MSDVKKGTDSGCWCVGLTRLFWLVLLTLLSMAVSAAGRAPADSVMLGERPSSNGEATSVEVNLFVFDIDDIDDVNQRFSVDMFIVGRWHDPRLALPEAEREGQTRFMLLDDVWTPRLLVLNERGLTSKLRQGVEVADLEFQDFPFDVQRLPIDIVHTSIQAMK